jgi:serine/threonine-protein kinase
MSGGGGIVSMVEAAERSLIPDVGVLVAGRYRITGILGQGGMGLVLSARDEREERDVAFKLLQSVGDADIQRFLREARVAAKLVSEHIVRVLDVGSRAGRPFLVMDRLRGEDYGALLRRTTTESSHELVPLPLVEVADCVVQTCEALAHAHGAGIVHRDIKASNLFSHQRADGSRIVKVLDFGISKILPGAGEPERTLTRTQDGSFLGSPAYMSPEHVRDPRTVDGRSDLWSLGVVAYRLLSARYPFAGDSAKEVLAAILAHRPPRMREHGIDVPDEVEALILRCLAPDREGRFTDAGALASAFSPFASWRWRGYGAIVPNIVSNAPALPSPPDDVPAPHLAGARGLLDDPPTMTVVPPVREPIETAPMIERTDPRISTTLPMASLPLAPRSPPLPARTDEVVRRRSSVARIALALGCLAALLAVGLGLGLRMRMKGPPSPLRADAPPTASSPAAPGAALQGDPGPTEVAPPAAVPAAPSVSAATPLIASPRGTRHHGTMPPSRSPPSSPSPPASSEPKSVLQPNPYAH